jgi:hypothetical protein
MKVLEMIILSNPFSSECLRFKFNEFPLMPVCGSFWDLYIILYILLLKWSWKKGCKIQGLGSVSGRKYFCNILEKEKTKFWCETEADRRKWANF